MVTASRPPAARPEQLAARIRGHRQIENGLHRVRDATYAQDLSRPAPATPDKSQFLAAAPREGTGPGSRGSSVPGRTGSLRRYESEPLKCSSPLIASRADLGK
jgi:hypothetical protein